MVVVVVHMVHFDDLNIDLQTVDDRNMDLGSPDTHVDWELPLGQRQRFVDTHRNHNLAALSEHCQHKEY